MSYPLSRNKTEVYVVLSHTSQRELNANVALNNLSNLYHLATFLFLVHMKRAQPTIANHLHIIDNSDKP